MPTADEVVTFLDVEPPPGKSPWLPGCAPSTEIAIVGHDPAWAEAYADLAARVRDALGFRVLELQHVGSTSVPGLAAKPIIDLDLVLADPDDEDTYVPALAEAGFTLRVREPWWYRHRMLRADTPPANLHVFGIESPEPMRHRLFRDWLRENQQDRAAYAAAKAEAATAASARGEDVQQYNARKQVVIREIYGRAFAAAGLHVRHG